MTVVMVHGVPDTHRVWDELAAALGRKDVVKLSLPGFGAAVPAGFGASKDDYAAWLIGELEKIGGEIDLVGHDWGALLSYRAVSLRSDLVRSWAAGGAPLDPDYVWHDAAQAWQTPAIGEQVMEMMSAPAMTDALAQAGLTRELAARAAGHVDATMKDCILKLYRSATRPFDDWGAGLADASAPGMVIFGAADPYVQPRFAYRLGERMRAQRVLVIKDCGHWWESQRPDFVAAELMRFWATL